MEKLAVDEYQDFSVSRKVEVRLLQRFEMAELKASAYFLQEILRLLLFPMVVSYLLLQQSQLLYGLKIPLSIKFYHLSLIYSKLLWSPELSVL